MENYGTYNKKVKSGSWLNSNASEVDKYYADDINTLLSIIGKYSNITFVGDGALLHKNLLNSNNIFESPYIHSSNINKCAYKKFKDNNLKNADTLLPMYLRKSQAERMLDENAENTNS